MRDESAISMGFELSQIPILIRTWKGAKYGNRKELFTHSKYSDTNVS